MKRSLSSLLCSSALALVMLTPYGFAQEPTPKQVAPTSAADYATKMQGFYEQTRDFQASFKQVYTDVAAGDKKQSFGRIYFKRPGMMRFDYYKLKAGKQLLEKNLVSDGKAFWIYEQEFQQVFKECLTDNQLPTALRFLMGQGNLKEEFNIELTKNSKPSLPELKLVPKKPTSKYKELRFILDPKTFQVVKTTVYDPYGNTNELFFDKILLNKNLEDKGFKFVPPKGARQLNPDKSCP